MNYKCLNRTEFNCEQYSIVPIRYQDRLDIMKWRNEQIYHLRQTKALTEADQSRYFDEVVSKLFDEDYPNQILFSYLEGDKCIGYGGLVHINWMDKNAEISFIMDTALEKDYFKFHWQTYLSLIEKVAFEELGLHKIYTYAFDLRPHLYNAIEEVGYQKEAVLKEHCFFNGRFKDVLIHCKFSPINIRNILEEDLDIIYQWANNEESRKNSFHSKEISISEHSKWFKIKIDDQKSDYYIVYYQGEKSAFVRFDLQDTSSTIGINVAPKYRGRGLSSIFLHLCCQLHFNKYNINTIDAYIKPENIPSQKVFQKAGFQFYSDEIVNQHKALLFKRIRNEK